LLCCIFETNKPNESNGEKNMKNRPTFCQSYERMHSNFWLTVYILDQVFLAGSYGTRVLVGRWVQRVNLLSDTHKQHGYLLLMKLTSAHQSRVFLEYVISTLFSTVCGVEMSVYMDICNPSETFVALCEKTALFG